MAYVLTEASIVVCPHQGQVQIVASQQALKIDGKAALVQGDLEGKPIAGCTAASPGTKPCTTVASVLSGFATKLTAGGKPVLLDSLHGLTDGTAGNSLSVQSAGQTKLGAS